ncbi:MAG: PQQ-binding-like beta-propeller repeat protein [Pseudomonadota bacterium]
MVGRRTLAWTLAGITAVLLSGCEQFDFFSSEEPPLPGKRISIMTFNQSLESDPALANLEVLLPKPYTNADWSQAGGVPTHAMYHLELTDQPREVWRVSIGDGSDDDRQVLAQPIVFGNRVFTMDSRSLISAFDTSNGRVLWEVDLEIDEEDDGFFGGGLAFYNDRLFVTTGFGMVFALDAGNGNIVWSQQVPGPMRAAPTVSGERVYVITLDNRAFALAADDGRRLWEHSGIQETAHLLGAASPAVAGSTVIVPYSSGEIFSMLAENGRVLWTDGLSAINRVDPIGDLAHIRGLPVIDRDVVLAVSHSGTMAAIDLRRGERVWDAELGGVQMPWVAGDFIYLLTNDAQVVCLWRRDGRIRWVRPLPQFEDPEDKEDPIRWVGPILAGNRLIIAGSHGVAVSISPYDGSPLGTIDLPGTPAVAPVIAERTLYFVMDDAELVALR